MSDTNREAFEKAFPDKPYLDEILYSESGRKAIPLFCGKGKGKDGSPTAFVAVVATFDSIIQFVEYDDLLTKFAPKGQTPNPAPVKVKGKPGRKPKAAVQVQEPAAEIEAPDMESAPAEDVTIE